MSADTGRMLYDTSRLYDKNHRPIEVGDILKVFHFVGVRKKRHYMYKQVVRFHTFNGHDQQKYYYLSHLDMKDTGGYYICLDGSILVDYEIVQSIDAAFEDRLCAIPFEGNCPTKVIR